MRNENAGGKLCRCFYSAKIIGIIKICVQNKSRSKSGFLNIGVDN